MTAVAQQQSMTVEEFVAWADARPEKHWELFEGLPALQQAQNWGHAHFKYRIARLLEEAIEASGLPLSFGVDGIVVKAGPRTAFEPDVVVFAGQMSYRDIIAPDPVIVVEVLSASTARRDLTVKVSGYFDVLTVQHYLVADWEERKIVHHRRQGEGLAPPEIVRTGVLRLTPPGLDLNVGALFK
jgi:Uma2 family endonuclease